VPDEVVLSVRGEAQHAVAPDAAVLHGQLSAFALSKSEALALVRTAQDALVGALAALGAVPLTPDTERAAVTWSVTSVGTHDERNFDPDVPAGRIFASADLQITVRDFAQLSAVGDSLGRLPALHLHGVNWTVDSDNPGWPVVRAAAIQAALAKGHDYAAALGGAVRRVQQVADAGLLGGTDATDRFGYERAPAAFAVGGRAATPSLDPVPQQLHAVVEARLIADVPPLA